MKVTHGLPLLAVASVAHADLFVKDFNIRLSGFERRVDLSADGTRVVVAVFDEKTRRPGDAVLFDASGKIVDRWAVQAHSVQLLADGRVLAVGDDHAYLLASGGAKQDLGLARTAVASTDGAWVAILTETHTREPKQVVVRTPTGAPQVVVPAIELVQAMAFSADGMRLAVVTNQSTGDEPGGKTHVAVFERRDRWRPLVELDAGSAQQADQVAFVGNAQLLVDAQLFDLKTRAVVKTLSKSLAVASSDGKAVMLHDDTDTPRWAKIVDGKLGALQTSSRPTSAAFPADRPIDTAAINASGAIVWCNDTRCTVK